MAKYTKKGMREAIRKVRRIANYLLEYRYLSINEFNEIIKSTNKLMKTVDKK